ncbi:MAG TPA: pirin family protein [Steroidobacteraceae bacterium]|nr:pirin family protein [Steroidobacteraceae bacterium]
MSATASSAGVTLKDREAERLIRGRPTSDGAGVRLTRVIGGQELPDLDPFLLLDEFGSSAASDYIGGFPDHPHRGFETVTYMLEGRMRHRDNHGNEGLLTPGSVQWMTAGRGIVHSEMPEQQSGRMRGFQLWVNLPAKDKMIEPRYQDIAPERIELVRPAPGIEIRVIAGVFGQTQGPVQGVATDPLYLDIALSQGSSLSVPVPAGLAAFAYIFEGQARLGVRATQAVRGDLAVLSDGEVLQLSTPEAAARLILVAGKPLNEPVVRYGPFVMNTRAQIGQAVEDYNAGRF